MRELVVFSWNVERMGKDKAEKMLPKICEQISKAVYKASYYSPIPFIGFLLEVKGEKISADKMVGIIKAKLSELFLFHYKTIYVSHVSCEAVGPTAERIIVIHAGGVVTPSNLVAEEDLKKVLKELEDEAKAKADKQSMVRQGGGDKANNGGGILPQQSMGLRKHPQASKIYGEEIQKISIPDKFNYLNTSVNPKWYRNGIVCSFTEEGGGSTLRIGCVHAPGPLYSNNVPQIPDLFMSSAKKNKVDIFVGDFNVNKHLGNDDFIDAHHKLPFGTTIGKVNKDKFGGNRWDHILMRKGFPYRGVVYNPIHPGFIFIDEDQKRLSDHGILICKFNCLASQNPHFISSEKTKESVTYFTMKGKLTHKQKMQEKIAEKAAEHNKKYNI